MSYTLERNDYLERLKDKIIVLQLLCKNYDNDKKYSLAKEMAVAVRVIVHDAGRNSVSLLSHLGSKDNIQMLSTMIRAEPGTLVLFGEGLCAMHLESGQNGCHLRYLPKLQVEDTKDIPFSSWWDEEVLHDMADDYESQVWYTRKDLVIAYSNKEGGAHVDSNLPDEVVRQSSERVSGWGFSLVDTTGKRVEAKADNTPKDATVRQIVYELLYSLYGEYPDLFVEKYF